MHGGFKSSPLLLVTPPQVIYLACVKKALKLSVVMHMGIIEMFKSRRSIRKYKPTPVEDEKLNAALEAAKWAPSAGARAEERTSTRKELREIVHYERF